MSYRGSKFWSSKFGDAYPNKTDLSNPPVSIFSRVIPQKQMSEYMSITSKFGGLDSTYFLKTLPSHPPPPPGMEDAELIIDSVHSLMGKIPFYDLELPYFYVKCVGYMPISYND